ncbi:MAG TPA: response regulator [Candidatus Thermoplasmatota archaeon]|nr:response regulator [Candidatus Thermoplasmatota archaeon]
MGLGHVVNVLLSQRSEPGGTAKRPRILVVDDEPDILAAVRTVLEGTIQAHVYVASSGQKALSILAANEVDLIVTDYKMPGMNGLEFLRHAKIIAPHTPVVLITAFERELVEELDGADQAEAVLIKPLSPRPLVQTVQKALAGAAP